MGVRKHEENEWEQILSWLATDRGQTICGDGAGDASAVAVKHRDGAGGVGAIRRQNIVVRPGGARAHGGVL